MWQTVSDCRSRWLLVMKSYALQSPVVYLNTHSSVETESLLISHYAAARSSFVSSLRDPRGP